MPHYTPRSIMVHMLDYEREQRSMLCVDMDEPDINLEANFEVTTAGIHVKIYEEQDPSPLCSFQVSLHPVKWKKNDEPNTIQSK